MAPSPAAAGGASFGPAFTIGFAFGWGYFTVAFHWLGAAFFVEGGVMLALMPFAILALAAHDRVLLGRRQCRWRISSGRMAPGAS